MWRHAHSFAEPNGDADALPNASADVPGPNAVADPDTFSDADVQPIANAVRRSRLSFDNPEPHPDTDADANAYAESNTHTNAYADTNADGRGNGHADRDGQACMQHDDFRRGERRRLERCSGERDRLRRG